MPTAAQKRAETIRARRAQQARMQAPIDAVKAAVATGKCPDCGRAIKRNNALAGWYQCTQFGAEGFRADASQPACNWQGFTE